MAPGQIPTRLATETGAIGDGGVGAPDSIALPAATMLYLTSGRADWLSGRFVYSSSGWLLPTYLFSAFFLDGRFCSSNWDMAEVERDWKDVILQKGGLLNKLYIPTL